jgi:hypothetical protein
VSDLPVITLSPLDADGILLFPHASVEFQQALHPARTPDADPLHPFAVLIANSTSRDVIAYSLRWICARGDKTIYHETNVFNLRSENPGETLASQRARIASIIQGVGGGRLASSPMLRQQVAALSGFYQNQDTINIAVEAVIFADGVARGPDRNNWIPRWQAYMDADRDLSAHIVQSPAGGLRGFLEESVNRAAALLPEGAAERPDSFAVFANQATAYQDCYTLLRGHFARLFLRTLDQEGGAALIARLQTASHWRRYPEIHR